MSDSLRGLADKVPGVADRALLQLVNGTLVARAVTSARSRQSTFARIVGQVSGRDRQAQLLTLKHLVAGQTAMSDWLTELSAQAEVTHLATARVAVHLASVRRRTTQLEGDLDDLATTVEEVRKACDDRLADLEQWRARTDLRAAAMEAVVFAGHELREGTYEGVPWPYVTLLLARALAAGPCGEWEHLSGDRRYRAHAAERIAEALPAVPSPDRLLLTDVLDDSWSGLGAEDRLLLAEMLDVGLDPVLALPAGPLTETASLTMELAALSNTSRPEQPAGTALALIRQRQGWVDGTASLKSLVRDIVDEQFDAAAGVWARVGQ